MCAPFPPSRRCASQVVHLVTTHGQRYTVNQTRATLLGPLLKQGRTRIRDYVHANAATVADAADEFRSAVFENVTTVG